MPAIRQVSIQSDKISFDSVGVTKTLTYASMPASQNTIAKVESFINSWLASNVNSCQMVCHIFSINPVKATIYTANLGDSIPANWWVD